MHRLFASMLAPLIEALEPRTIVEVGAGSGRLTRKLLEAPGADGAVVHAIDPSPQLDPGMVARAGERLRLHRTRSIAALGGIGAADLAVLDGDPNWHTTHAELTMLIDAARREGRPAPLVVVHNVHWPFGRRDGYHDPEAIPEAHRHPYTDLGLVPGRREPSPDGLRLTPYCAERDFVPASGVMTGVEDALAESDLAWTLVDVPGFNGCAVMAEARLLEEKPALGDVIERMRGASFHANQARRAESARLAVEVELAALRGDAPEAESSEVSPVVNQAAPAEQAPATPEGATPEETAAIPEEAALEEEYAGPSSAPFRLQARLAREAARREALEWRLERVDEDLAGMQARLDALQRERDEATATVAETRVRLERANEDLASERRTVETLRERVGGLEGRLEDRQRELDESLEREKLIGGRLSHREDALQAATAESAKLRKQVERAGIALAGGRALMDEIADQVARARSRPGARLGRRLRRAGRAVALRRSSRPEGPLGRIDELANRGISAPEEGVAEEGSERVWSTAPGVESAGVRES